MSLSDAETARFARQLLLPGFAAEAQGRLRAARVQVVGGAAEVAGPSMLYLAMAGVGSLLIDDGLDVTPDDAVAWLYPLSQVGQPRAFAAASALREATSLSRTRPMATGVEPTVVLVCATSLGMASEGAERARKAGLPHVVAVPDGEGGEVVSVPAGAPCYACGSRPGTSGIPRPGAPAALGTLAALELVLLLSGTLPGMAGRRVELAGAGPQGQPTVRMPGCSCGR